MDSTETSALYLVHSSFSANNAKLRGKKKTQMYINWWLYEQVDTSRQQTTTQQ